MRLWCRGRKRLVSACWCWHLQAVALSSATLGPARHSETAILPKARAVAIWLLCCCAMIFGMVESGLADRTDVSQYRLVAHLALALAIYGLTLWIALGLFAPDARVARDLSPHPSSASPRTPSPARGGGSLVANAFGNSLPRKRR